MCMTMGGDTLEMLFKLLGKRKNPLVIFAYRNMIQMTIPEAYFEIYNAKSANKAMLRYDDVSQKAHSQHITTAPAVPNSAAVCRTLKQKIHFHTCSIEFLSLTF